MSSPEATESHPFRTWNGRDSWEFVDGVRLHAIGGDQVLSWDGARWTAMPLPADVGFPPNFSWLEGEPGADL